MIQSSESTPDVLLTYGAAAELIGVSLRTVHRYVKTGILLRVDEGGKPRISVTNAERARARLENGRMPALSALHCKLLEAELHELEQAYGIIGETLDLAITPLNLSDEEAASLFRSVLRFSAGTWPPNSERVFARVFIRLRLTDLRRMERVTTQEAWPPFIELARAMTRSNTGDLVGTLLLAGRANLFKLATLCIEEKHGRQLWRQTIRGLGAVDRNTMRRAARRKNQEPRAKYAYTDRHKSLSESDVALRSALDDFLRHQAKMAAEVQQRNLEDEV